MGFKNILYFITLLIIGSASRAIAQDPMFTQYYATPVLLNPAFSGNTLAPRVALIYRDQWHNVPNAYSTFGASYDQFFEKFNSGIGVTLMADQAGDGIYKTNNANITYAYRVKTRNDVALKIGIDLGVGQTSLDWNKLVFLDMIDPLNGNIGGTTQETAPTSLQRTYADLGAGFVAYSKKFYAGLSMKHLNSPNTNFLNANNNVNLGLPIRYTLNTGYEIVLKENRKHKATAYITPNILFVKQGRFGMINASVQGGLNNLFGGIGFRHALRNSDAVLINVGMQKGIFKIGYSHDITINGLPNSWGAHELSVVLNFDELYDRRKPNYLDCFRFFR